MLVVEGPDGAGKSTMVQFLTKTLGFPVEPKIVASDTTSTANKKAWTEEQINRGFGKRIYDRFCLISEPIYNSIMKPHPEPGYDDPAWMCPWTWRFYSQRPVIIWCMPALDIVKNNILQDENNQVIVPYIDKIYGAYAARMAMDLLLPSLATVYDYQVDSATAVLPIIQARLEEWP